MNNILIIGSGGREHALCWKLKQSPKVKEIFIAPGNAGTSQVGTNIDIKTNEFNKLIEFAKKEAIYLTIVGPDDPLAGGIVDAFQAQNLKIWGPTKKAAQIETSKAFAKELMQREHIPTAKYKIFTDYPKAFEFLETQSLPIVIKASGLALGKGVTVCRTFHEAKIALKNAMMDKIFGGAGEQVVIEKFLDGQEFSIHAFSDGKTFKLLPPSQDHKTVYNKNEGPNTGGMGTIAPVPWVNEAIMQEIASTIVKPALEGLTKLDAVFMGLLYPGLMMTKDGPVVIEFNARLGDPETQSYMRLLKTDLFDVLMASVDGKLDEINIEWENKYACCIVLASGGYPGEYKKGLPITGIEEAEKMEDVVVFHAGTSSLDNGLPAKALATAGGRVLGITATADDLQTALNKAYSAVKLIHFKGMHYRTDIGQKSLAPSSPFEGRG